MGLFGDVDAASIPDNPYFVDDGTYRVTLLKAEVKKKKNPNPDNPYVKGLSLRYKIDEDEEEYGGKTLSTWLDLVDTGDRKYDDLSQDEKDQLSRLKQRLLQHGIPEENHNDDDLLENLQGIVGYATVVVRADNNDETKKYSNMVAFTLPEL